MQIFVKIHRGKQIIVNVNDTDTIKDIKQMIQDKEGINSNLFNLKYINKQLNDSLTIKQYCMHHGSIIDMSFELLGGILCTEVFQPVIGDIGNNYNPVPLFPSKLGKRIIRNTNSCGVYRQIGGVCYAIAAASAYINTILRIYGAKPPPSFEDCFKIALYSKNGGDPKVSIELLEKKFHYGIICSEYQKNINIVDAIQKSVIISFATTKFGWEQVNDGEFLSFTDGKLTCSHSSYVDGYDLSKDCLICQNSWGAITSKSHFDIKPNATHLCEYLIVYFTMESINNTYHKILQENIQYFSGVLENKPIECAWMDKQTATYKTDFICEFHPEHDGGLQYLGYNVCQYVNIYLNRH